MYVFQAPGIPISVTSRAKIVSWTVTFAKPKYPKILILSQTNQTRVRFPAKFGSEIVEQLPLSLVLFIEPNNKFFSAQALFVDFSLRFYHSHEHISISVEAYIFEKTQHWSNDHDMSFVKKVSESTVDSDKVDLNQIYWIQKLKWQWLKTDQNIYFFKRESFVRRLRGL